MTDFLEKRQANRVTINCELHFKAIDSFKSYQGYCIDLSHNGISFCSEYTFKVGEKLAVHVRPDPPIMFSTSFIAKIVRVEQQSDGHFKVGASIEYEEDSFLDLNILLGTRNNAVTNKATDLSARFFFKYSLLTKINSVFHNLLKKNKV